MDKFNIKAHSSFLGKSGYNNHSRNFFTALNKFANVKVRNFSMDGCNLFRGPDGGKIVYTKDDIYVDVDWKKSDPYITEEIKDMLIQQSYHSQDTIKDLKFKDYEFPNEPINIVLNEVGHFYFKEDFPGKKIGYFVWETDRISDDFYKDLLKYDQVWVPSKWQKECLEIQGFDSKKIKVVPEAVDDVFIPSKKNYKSDKIKFVVIGRWDYRKSTTEIIKSFIEEFDNNENVELILNVDNGYNPEGIPKTTEDKLKFFKLEDNRIRIKHFLNREDYVKLIQDADVFVSCARGEGWNLPLIEAMACGIPSLYSDCCAQLEFAEGKGFPVKVIGKIPANNSSNNGFNYGYTPGNYYEPDFVDLKKQMRHIYENLSEAKEKALKESEEIRNVFSWKNAAKIAIQHIKELYFPKRAFVTHITGNYADSIDALVESVGEFSTLPLIVYTINFETDKFKKYPWVKTIRKNVEEVTGSPKRVEGNQKDYIDRHDDNTYYVLTLKPQVMLDAIEKGLMEGVYLDGDTLILPNAEELFYHLPDIENYPLVSRGVFEVMGINGEWYVEKPLQDIMKTENRNFYLQTNTILFNSNCYNFIRDWNYWCRDRRVVSDWKKIAPYHEETIINVLLWKNNYTKRLPLSFYNVGSFKSFMDMWNFDDSDKSIYNYEMQGFRINTDSEYEGWQIIPWDKSDIKILHNIKKKDDYKKIINYIKKNNNQEQYYSSHKILFITPHLSTGGLPEVLRKRIEVLKDYNDVYVVELTYYGSYDVQRKNIIKMIGENKFFSLGNLDEPEEIHLNKRMKLIDIINQIQPDIVHMEEIAELSDLPDSILKLLYSQNRYYSIIESTHTSTFDISKKRWYPDKFMFVSDFNLSQYSNIYVDKCVIEYPLNYKNRNNNNPLNLDSDYIHILNVGLFTPGKNQSYIFDMARQLQNEKIKFHFVGNQAGNFENYWKPLMQNKPDNCIVWDERDDLENFYSSCDLFLFPSTYELNPLVIKEALSYGMKILMNKLPIYKNSYDNNEYVKYLSMNLDYDCELLLEMSKIDIKKSDIAVVSFGDKNYEKIAITAKKNFNRYCKKHNYDFIYETKSYDENLAPQWNKMYIIRKYLDIYEYVFWIDSDCLFMNQDIKLESFIDDSHDFWAPKLLYSMDNEYKGGSFSSGTFLVRSCDLTKKFFDEAINYNHNLKNSFDHEQRIMRILLNNNSEYSDKFRLLEPSELDTVVWINNAPRIILDEFGYQWNFNNNIYKDGDFIIHFAGYEYNERFKLMQLFDGRLSRKYDRMDIDINDKNEFSQALIALNLKGNGVEIGSYKGEFAKKLLSVWSGQLYMVDSWRHLNDYVGMDSGDDDFHKKCMEECFDNVKDYKDRAHIIRMLSEDASKMFPEGFFDFIYINGNPDYEHTKKDLEFWYPKIRQGGLISGNNYIPIEGNQDIYVLVNGNETGEYAGKIGVKQAVDEFANRHGQTVRHTTTEQYWRQWYFIKK